MNRLVPIGLAIAGLALPAMPLLAQHDAHTGHQMAADPIAAAVAAPREISELSPRDPGCARTWPRR